MTLKYIFCAGIPSPVPREQGEECCPNCPTKHQGTCPSARGIKFVNLWGPGDQEDVCWGGLLNPPACAVSPLCCARSAPVAASDSKASAAPARPCHAAQRPPPAGASAAGRRAGPGAHAATAHAGATNLNQDSGGPRLDQAQHPLVTLLEQRAPWSHAHPQLQQPLNSVADENGPAPSLQAAAAATTAVAARVLAPIRHDCASLHGNARTTKLNPPHVDRTNTSALG